MTLLYRSHIPFLALFLLLTLESSAQWVRSAHSQAFSRASSISHDAANDVYTTGSLTCVTTIGGMSLQNNSCAEISFPAPGTQIDGFVAKHNEDGDLVWLNHYLGKPGNKLFFNDIATDPAGNSYVVGVYTDSVDLLMPAWYYNEDLTMDVFIMRVLPDGSTDWVATIDTDSISESYAQRIAITDNALYITGYLHNRFTIGTVSDSVGNNQAFVAAYDLSGNPLWTKYLYNGDPASSSRGQAVTATGDSIWTFFRFDERVVIEGDTISPPGTLTQAGVLVHYNAAGAMLDYKITTTPYIEDIKVYTPDSSIYVTGRAEDIMAIGQDTLFYTNGIRAFVSSMDMSGNHKWAIPITSSGTAGLTGTRLSVNSDSSIIATGTFRGAAVTSPSASANGGGDLDGYVVKIDSAGVDEWIQTLGGARDDVVMGTTTPDDDHIYVSGYFDQYVRVAGEEIFNVTSNAKNNGFWARIDVCPQLVADMISPDTTYVCDRDSALFQVNNNALYTYEWFKDDLPITSSGTPALYVTEGGMYNALVTGLGCTKYTPYARLLIRPLPDSVVTSSDDLDLCEGDTITLSGSLATYSFQWFRDNDPLSAETSRDIEVFESGDYHLQITDSWMCSILSDTFPVTVHPYPSNSLTPSGRHVICSGDSVRIQADDSQVGMKYQWRNGDIDLPNETLSLFVARTEGRYSAVIENAVGCQTITEVDTVVVQQSPVVDLNDETAPHAVCTGQSVKLVTPQIIGQSYQWIRNSADIPGATTNSLDIFTAGDYQVRVNNSLCELITDPFSVTINPLPLAGIVNAQDTAVCLDDDYVLQAVTSPDFHYQWYRNGLLLNDETLPELPIAATGNYSVEITNAFNCKQSSASTSVTLNIQPPASAIAQGPTTFCQGASVVLRANPGTGLSYQWFFNGLSMQGEVNQDVEVSASGLYAVEVTNVNQCSSISADVETTIVAYPVATIQSAGNLNAICERDSLELTGGSDPGYEFTWMYNQQTLSHSGITLYATLPGNYRVIAAVGNCRDTSNVLTLNLRPNPLPVITRDYDFLSIALFGDIQWYNNNVPVPNSSHQVIQVQARGYYKVRVANQAGCVAWSDSLPVCLPIAEIEKRNNILTVNVDAQDYVWNYDGIPVNGATQRILTAQQSGSYTAIVTDHTGCVMETAPVIVCIPFPVISQDPVSGVLYGHPNPAVSYQWYIEGDNAIYNPLIDATTQVHIPDFPGIYKVEVMDLEGCLSFSEPFEVSVITGAEDEPGGLSIYPNPVKSTLIMERSFSGADTPFVLLSSEGKLVLKDVFFGSTTRVDLEDVSSGIYWLIIGKGQHRYMYKIIKE